LRDFLKPEAIKWQYPHGTRDESLIAPEAYALDAAGLLPQAPAAAAGRLGENDPFFLPPGAEAWKCDIPKAEVRFFDTGHFALETHAKEIGIVVRAFLDKNVK
jgi:surfactin synthase thioesterase subunit